MIRSRPVKCSYCRRPAVAWLRFPGRSGIPGRRAIPGHTVGACEEHRTCTNFQSNIATHPEIKLEVNKQ